MMSSLPHYIDDKQPFDRWINFGELVLLFYKYPSVLVIPRQIEDVENTSKKIADILNMSLEKAKSYVTQNASIVRIHPEGRKINKEQEKAIRELNVKGIYLVKDSKRHYPYGNYLSHVLGFTGIDNQGLMGLELAHDDRLKGKKGNISYLSDEKGVRDR